MLELLVGSDRVEQRAVVGVAPKMFLLVAGFSTQQEVTLHEI